MQQSALCGAGVVAVAAGSGWLLSSCGGSVIVGAAPLMPFYALLLGGPHGGGLLDGLHESAAVWLVLAAAFATWWGICDVGMRFARRRQWPALLGGIAVPLAWYALAASFFLAKSIPDSDPLPEQGGLEEVCRLTSKAVSETRATSSALVSAPDATFALLGDSSQRYWLLDSRTCALQEITDAEAAASDPTMGASAAPHGGSPRSRHFWFDPATGQQRWITVDMSGKGKVLRGVSPRISRNGLWAAWREETPEHREQVKVASLGQPGGFHFDPDGGSHHVIDVSADGAVLLYGYRGYHLIGAPGKVVWTFRPRGVQSSFDNVRVSLDARNYLAWDYLREDGRNAVVWRIGDRFVREELPPHSSVSSAAVSATGSGLP